MWPVAPSRLPGTPETLQGETLAALLDQLGQAAPLGATILDRELRFAWLNRTMADIDGLSMEAHLGRSVEEVLPDLAPTIVPIYRRVLEGGEPIVELAIAGETPARPGDRRAWRASYYPLRGEDGTVRAVGAIVLEVTELQRLEIERQRLLERITDGFVSFDRDMRYRYVNERAAAMLGRPTRDLIGQGYYELFPEAVGTPFEQAYARALRDQEAIILEDHYAPWDRWFENRIFPSEDGLTILFSEITGRKRVEADMARQRRRLGILNSIHHAVLMGQDAPTMSSGALAAVLVAFEAQFGVLIGGSPGETSGTILAVQGHGPVFQVGSQVSAPPDVASAALVARITVVEDLAARVEPTALEQAMLADGVRAYVTVPLLVEGGLAGSLGLGWSAAHSLDAEVLGLLHDVSEGLAVALAHIVLRSQVQAHTEELEERVRDRTAQLSEINAELDAFSSTVSHDLRAPLRGMRGLAQALLEDEGDRLSPIGRDYARRIVAAGRRMDELIEGLLAYSRLARADLRRGPVSLARALDAARSQLEAEIRARGARVEVAGPLGNVVAHRTTLVQVILNLLSNACKFSRPDERPEILVREERGEETTRLWVEDRGIGIDPAFAERIFRPFERLHGMEAYPGSGIGLAIVHKGVSRMGGHCGVEPRDGGGSRFWIELPVARRAR